jgi:hypothetical protein
MFATGGTLALSVLYFYFPVYGGVHWFNGPVSTIKDVKSHIALSSDTNDKDGIEMAPFEN